jgi:hypothetical protein
MLLSQEDIALNNHGTLTAAQRSKFRRKGYAQLIASLCFLVLVPFAVFMADMRWGTLLIIWLAFGLLFAGVFMHTALSYLRLKDSGHEIKNVQGKVTVKTGGSRHNMVTIAERSFFMMKNESSSLEDGKEYTLYYLEKPKQVLGWTEKVSG